MIRIALAAAAAFALAAAAPAFACGDDCPMHKTAAGAKHEHGTTVAAADKVEKKGEQAACACGHDHKDCKCAQGKCECAKKEKTEKTEKKS